MATERLPTQIYTMTRHREQGTLRLLLGIRSLCHLSGFPPRILLKFPLTRTIKYTLVILALDHCSKASEYMFQVHAGRRAGADAVAMSRESVLLDGAIARCGMEGVTRVVSNVTFRGGAGAGIGSSQEDMLRRDVLLALDKIRF